MDYRTPTIRIFMGPGTILPENEAGYTNQHTNDVEAENNANVEQIWSIEQMQHKSPF